MPRRKQYVELLAEALILNPTAERHLAMFSAYLDESGKGNERKNFIAVGGLVSSSLQWGRLQNDWTKHLLRVPGIPLDGQGKPIPFHMADFESRNWPTKRYLWRSERTRSRFLHGLIDIMCHRVKLRVFTVIWLAQYHTLFPKDRRYKLPWVLCALGCASRISKWAEQRPSRDDPVPFIFEQGGEGWGIAHDAYRELKQKGKLGKMRIGTWAEDDKHIAGLQAADLWAWELRHHFEAQLPYNPPYVLRGSLEKLMLGVPDGAGFAIGGAEVQILMEDLRLGTSRTQPVTFRSDGLPRLIHGAL
ncbi:MAG: DUF3800 domain-containing protein [Acidobacteriia bacterium]|nr:DUF3800 domain-containing protein [Terriglobia bacterium]